MRINRTLLSAVISLIFFCQTALAQIPYLDEASQVYQKAYVNKDVLDSQDLDIIERFVNAGIDSLLNAYTSHESAKIRKEITSLSGSKERDQYSQQFIVTLEKKLPEAFQKVNAWEEDRPVTRTTRDLLILITQVSAPELVNNAIDFMNSQNLTVRYWAVKAIANPDMIDSLNSGDYEQLRADIFEKLNQLIENENSDEILQLAVKFASRFTDAQGTNIIETAARKRIDDYEKWDVGFELIEADILKALANSIQNASGDRKKQLAAIFAQLYSHVIQRYIKGKEFLTSSDRTQLASVIVDVEQNVIGKLTGVPQSGLKKAIEMKIDSRIENEYKNLLAQSGTLQAQFNFQYDNPGQTGPRDLPEPQAKQ